MWPLRTHGPNMQFQHFNRMPRKVQRVSLLNSAREVPSDKPQNKGKNVGDIIKCTVDKYEKKRKKQANCFCLVLVQR